MADPLTQAARPPPDAADPSADTGWLERLSAPAALLLPPGGIATPNPALRQLLTQADGLACDTPHLALHDLFARIDGDPRRATRVMAELRRVMDGEADSVCGPLIVPGQLHEAWRMTAMRLGAQAPAPVLMSWVREATDGFARPEASSATTQRMREALERGSSFSPTNPS